MNDANNKLNSNLLWGIIVVVTAAISYLVRKALIAFELDWGLLQDWKSFLIIVPIVFIIVAVIAGLIVKKL